MCKFENMGVSWPPKGWNKLKELERTYGQAITKDPASAMVTGLTYLIEPLPIVKSNNTRTYVYEVSVGGWDYNIYNESCEYPILSYILHERTDKQTPASYYMSDLKIRSQPLVNTQRSCHRIFMASLFMMKQISLGKVPDAERILKLYKIHPSQRALYETDTQRHDSLFCGLSGFDQNLDQTKNA